MKTGLLITVLAVLIGILVFFKQPVGQLSVVLVGNTQGATAINDRRLLNLIEDQLKRSADAGSLSLTLNYLDVSQSQEGISNALAVIAEATDIDLLIGCTDSICMRRVLQVAENKRLPFIYPGSSEGLVDSNYLIHLGVIANQYLFPAVSWIRHHLGQRIFYVGGESVRSRMLGRMLSQQLLPGGRAGLVGEEYLSAYEQLPSIEEKIRDYEPDVVLFDACEWVLHPGVVSALSNSPARVFFLCPDLRVPDGVDAYFVSHYFDHDHNPENLRVRAILGSSPDALSVMAMSATQFLDKLYGDVLSSRSFDLVATLRGRNALTACGATAIDFTQQGSWHSVFIGRKDKNMESLLWMSDHLLRPVMFPGSEAPSDWLHYQTIYWRNNRGLWRSGTVNGEPWL
ncbi:MAG: transporter substrate-binding protein [Thalassolituus sp.]